MNNNENRLRLGSNETMVLNDYRLIAKAFKRDEFLGRPKHIAFNVLINLEGRLSSPLAMPFLCVLCVKCFQ